MIVLDASAALSGLLHEGPARVAAQTEQLHAPHVIDLEVASGLRRLAAAGIISDDHGRCVLDTWRRLGLTRYPSLGLLDRVWALRRNVSAYDAAYLALAEALGCSLVTADARLTRAPGLGCVVSVVPR